MVTVIISKLQPVSADTEESQGTNTYRPLNSMPGDVLCFLMWSSQKLASRHYRTHFTNEKTEDRTGRELRPPSQDVMEQNTDPAAGLWKAVQRCQGEDRKWWGITVPRNEGYGASAESSLELGSSQAFHRLGFNVAGAIGASC